MNTLYPSASSRPLTRRWFSTRELVLAGMFAAVMTIISQISIPMPTGVPLTIQVFGVALIGVVLGWRLGTFTILVYILLGAVGAPVFSSFHGGIGILLQLTGGYIWSWPLMALLCGIQPPFKNRHASLGTRILLSLLGLIIVEMIGAFQWAFLTDSMSLKAILLYSAVAFIPKDILITVLAVIIGLQIRKNMARTIHS